MSLRVPSDGVELYGDHGAYVRDCGLATEAEGIFCSACGSRVIHRGRGKDSGSSVKAGSLDDRSWLKPVGHIWTGSAQKWVKMDGLLYEGQPNDNYAALIEAFARSTCCFGQ